MVVLGAAVNVSAAPAAVPFSLDTLDKGASLRNTQVTDIFPFVIAVEKQTYGVPFYYAYDADSEQASLTVVPDHKAFNNIGAPNYVSGTGKPRYDNHWLQRDYAPRASFHR